ncbi:MAG: hypothetical protein H5T60_13840, partial [Anaerolineae bacterium]|nr:hypothetical protein [Anaerolineae bacterium]
LWFSAIAINPNWRVRKLWRIIPQRVGRNQETNVLGVRAIPTIVVFDAESGRELGRIVEEPRYGSLEQDLLEIVSAEEKSEDVLFLET